MRRITISSAVLFFGICAVCSCSLELTPLKETGALKYRTEIVYDGGSKVELDEGCTVWTENDSLSVFRSTVNEKYRFDGKTGDVRGTISKCDESVPGEAFSKSYAIYPYNAGNASLEEGLISYSFPVKQEYKQNSFALGANVMISSTSGALDDKLNFHNVCGYIKLRIYGSKACVLQSIKIYGNNDEKIAGPAIINTETLAVAMQTSATTNITLDFPSGMSLSTEPVDFWIAIPPVTFTDGFTVELTTDKGKSKTQSTNKEVQIERNHIVPMEAFTPNSSITTVEKVFVLYGDSITPQSVRTELQTLLDADPGESIGPDGFTIVRNKWKVVLAGVSGETPIHISSRQGGVPVYLKGPFTIPSEGSIEVGRLYSTWNSQAVVSAAPSSVVHYNTNGTNGYGTESTTALYSGCTNPFLVNGVQCTYDGSILTRITPGEEVKCEGEDFSGNKWVRVYPYVAWKYRDAYFSTYQGTNGAYNRTPEQKGNTYEVLTKFYDAETEYSTSKKHIIVGYHNVRWTQQTTDYFANYYSVHTGEYYDMLKVGTGRAFEIARILNKPLDSTDSLNVSKGIWPLAWSRSDEIQRGEIIHMSTPLGYSAYAVCVYLKMKELGWI